VIGLDPPPPQHNRADEAESSDQGSRDRIASKSPGKVHDIFAEYEDMFGAGKKKRAHLKLNEMPSARGSAHCTPNPEESVAEDDGAESHTEVGSDELHEDFAVTTGPGRKPPEAAENSSRKTSSRKTDCPFSIIAKEFATGWNVKHRPDRQF
jgi:hypothetical protein